GVGASFCRQLKASGRTAALVLASLVAFAAPVAAGPGQSGRLWASKVSSQHRSGKQQRFDKLDKDMKSRSTRLLGTSKVILTINPGQEANAEKEIKKLGGRVGRRLELRDSQGAQFAATGITQ